MKCELCGHYGTKLHYQAGTWVCRTCYNAPSAADTCRMFERGVENPMDPKGTTAHVRDIKARRLDPKTKSVFYYEKPRTYFFAK